MARIAVKGYRIGYDTAGSGTPVLFLHGLGADRRQSLNALSAAENVRVVAPDMPGHGESSRRGARAEELGFSAYADVALALLDKLCIRQAILGGTSMGAGVALAMALRNPGIVAGLLLVRPAWLAGPAHPHLTLVSEIGVLIQEIGSTATRRQVSRRPQFLAMQESTPGAAAAVLDMTRGRRSASVAPLLPAIVGDQPFSSLDELAQLRCPAVVLGNDLDPLHPPALAKTLASAIPGASYAHLPSRYLDPAAYQSALASELRALQTELLQA